MEIKSFNKITKEVFIAYGFKKIGKNYILELKDILLCVWLDSWHGLKSFHYSLSINALHAAIEPIEKRHDFAFSVPLSHNINPKGSQPHKLCIDEWTEMQYREILQKLLSEYFDSYKEKGLKHLKDIGHTLPFTEEAQMFLFSAMDVKMHMKEKMLRYYGDDSAYIALKGLVLSKTNNVSIKVHITTKHAELFTDESGNQEYSFYDNNDDIQTIKLGEEIKFFTIRRRFYNSLYPIIALIGGDKITYLECYPCLIEGKKKYIEWIEKTFPIQKD